MGSSLLCPPPKKRSSAKPSVPLAECSDQELMARCRAGQAGAFDTLVRRYEREVYAYLRRYLGRSDMAEDVFQNTFLKVYTKLDSYQPGRPVRPWLYTIAAHQAIDALRRKNRRQTVSLDQERERLPDGEVRSLIDLLVSRGPGPADQTQEKEQRDHMQAGVERLPEALRQVVVLAYYQGLKYREIANILGVPVGTVKSRLHAALAHLQ